MTLLNLVLLITGIALVMTLLLVLVLKKTKEELGKLSAELDRCLVHHIGMG